MTPNLAGRVMETSKKAVGLVSSFCLLALAACSGGGGGSGAALNTGTGSTSGNTTGNTSGNTSGNTTTTPTVSIGAPDHPNVAIQGSPTFNFTTNLPPSGTVFGLVGPAVKASSTTVEAAGTGNSGTVTFRGMASGTVPLFDVSIPAIGLTATNVHADGTPTTLADGSKVVLTISVLNYTAAGAWAYTPASGGIAYLGTAATGSGTPLANVPTSGSATYTGSGTKGGVAGAYFVPSGTGGISGGSLAGDIAITANFTSGGVTGTLSNMMATPATGGAATPWNSVSISANISRAATNASFDGSTSTSGAPAGAGAAGFSSAATGYALGGFFGPNADEVGGTWSLTDPGATGGGKTAFGAFAGATTSSGSTGSSGGTSGSTSGVSITAPGLGLATFSGTSLGTNFTTNLPPVGSALPLGGSTVITTPTSVASFTAGQITATWRGTVTSGGLTWPVIDLSIPSLSLNATNLQGDGTTLTLADGGKVNAKFNGLTYTLLGGWSYTPANGNTSYIGHVVTGYGTAPASVPTSGNATYTGTGGVVGAYFVPSGTTAIQAGTVNGDVTLNVNFASNTTNGSFTNMTATPIGGTPTPWNTITLTNQSMTRGTSAVTFESSASTTANTGAAGFSAAATGAAHGTFYGPTAQEVGGTWFLNETAGGGKTAFGTFGAKQ